MGKNKMFKIKLLFLAICFLVKYGTSSDSGQHSLTELIDAQLWRMAAPELLTNCNDHSDCPKHDDDSLNGQYCMKWSINKCTLKKPENSLCFGNEECAGGYCKNGFCAH